MRTAIRRGWLDDAPQADRDALGARFSEAVAARRAADPDTHNARAALAECWATLELLGVPRRAALRVLRYTWAGVPTGRTTGQPRERRHVSDCPNRIDANELLRRVKAEGHDLGTLREIDVRRDTDAPDDAAERIALAVVADPRYSWRVWLVCPGCKRWRAHLYPTRQGVRCRKCAGIGY